MPSGGYVIGGEVHLAVGYDEGIVGEGGQGVHAVPRRHHHGEETEAPLEHVAHGDGHRANVPVVAVAVLEGVAVARASDETAGLEGKGAVLGVGERAERTVGYVHAVAVNAPLCAGRSVLQIILAAVLQAGRALVVAVAVKLVVGSGGLPSVLGRVVRDERLRLAQGAEAVARVNLYARNRLLVVASGVEVDAPVVVKEERGVVGRVPEVRLYLRPRVALGRGVLEETRLAAARHVVQRAAVCEHGGGVILYGGYGGAGYVVPLHHVVGAPVAARLRREEVIAALEVDGHGVCRLAARGVAVVLGEAVVKVDGVSHYAVTVSAVGRLRRRNAGQHCRREGHGGKSAKCFH